MSTILPINLDNLLNCRGIESERVVFKGSWDDHTTGPQVLRTICAFANDFHNLNGGYIVIGVKEREGPAVPPAGLSDTEVETAQKWIRGNCNRLDPPYPPILSPEMVGDRRILVIWAPASDIKPHRAPSLDSRSSRYWVRIGSEKPSTPSNAETCFGDSYGRRLACPGMIAKPLMPKLRICARPRFASSCAMYGVASSTTRTSGISIGACASRGRSTITKYPGT